MRDATVLTDDSTVSLRYAHTPQQTWWSSIKTTQFVWPMLWLILLLMSLGWRTPNLDAFGLSNDEGAHLMWAKLAVSGYPLYEETRAVQSPLFLESIGLSFRLFGETIAAGRGVILVSFVWLTVVLSYLAYRGAGWLAALSALSLLSCSPLIFKLSRLTMAEVPATALAVSAVAFILPYLKTEPSKQIGLQRIWLYLSGLTFGLSLITKALHPFLVIPIASLIIYQHGLVRAIRDLLMWGLLALLPLISLLFIYHPSAMYEQLILFRDVLRLAIPGSWDETWQQVNLFVTSHWGYWLLATATLVIKHNPQTKSFLQGRIQWVWLIWLIASLGMLSWHTPLFPHHFITVLPPLILLASYTIAQALESFVNIIKTRSIQRSVWLLPVIVIATFNLPSLVEANQQNRAIVTGGREAEAITLLQTVTTPTDFVMGDSQLLIFKANRQTPPPLGDVALVAIKAGLQNSERMIGLHTTYHEIPAVVQWSLRLPWLPDYLTWVEANYLTKRVWDNDHIIYFVPRLPSNYPLPHAQTTQLGEAITLRGFSVDPISTQTSHLNLKLYWQTDRPLAEDLTVFTQLLTADGMLIAGWDSQPLGGHFPTSQWPVAETVTDIVQLPLPEMLSPGDYRLITGMYQLDTMERLPLADGSDFVQLTTLTVPSDLPTK